MCLLSELVLHCECYEMNIIRDISTTRTDSPDSLSLSSISICGHVDDDDQLRINSWRCIMKVK